MTRRRRFVVLQACAVLVAAIGIGAVVTYDDGAPQAMRTGGFEVSGRGDSEAIAPINGFEAARALGPVVDGYATPNPSPGSPPAISAPNPTWEGHPLTMSVLQARGEWLEVRLPARPNSASYWVRAAQVETWEVPNRIVVEVGASRLTVYRGDSDEVLYTTDVATGRPATPTPLGEFYIDIVLPIGRGIYGWGMLSVAGFSDVLYSFGGGIGQIAIHGWNDESVMGQHRSNGCVRMRNGDISQVAALAPLGTPVSIVA